MKSAVPTENVHCKRIRTKEDRLKLGCDDVVVSPVDASGILDGFWGGFIMVYPCLSTV